jgi:hypothetical protein
MKIISLLTLTISCLAINGLFAYAITFKNQGDIALEALIEYASHDGCSTDTVLIRAHKEIKVDTKSCGVKEINFTLAKTDCCGKPGIVPVKPLVYNSPIRRNLIVMIKSHDRIILINTD